MKVVYLISHLQHCGPVNALHDLLKGLLDERICAPSDLAVVTLSPERAASRLAEFRALGVDIVPVPVTARGLAGGVRALRRALIRLAPDVCHSHNVKADALLAAASPGLPFRRISTVHNVPAEDLRYLYSGVGGVLASALHYASLKLLRAPVVGCSRTVAEHVGRTLRVPTHVVLNPVAQPAAGGGAARNSHRLVSAAAVTERKNTRAMLQRFVASPECAPLELAVFGDGPLRPELERAFPDTRIAWLGYTKQLADELRAAAAYVSASLSEGMPLTPQIALLCGCPCVLSDIPQHREIAELSRRAFLFDPRSQASFDAAVRRALASGAAPASAELDALARRLSPATAAASYRRLYEALIAGETRIAA